MATTQPGDRVRFANGRGLPSSPWLVTLVNVLLVCVCAALNGFQANAMLPFVLTLGGGAVFWAFRRQTAKPQPTLQILAGPDGRPERRRWAEDPLTGLKGEDALKHLLGKAVGDAQPKALLAVIAFDIDRLKDINGFYGYAAGDRLLRSAAQRLQAREGDALFRLSGDRFVVVCPNMPSQADAETLAVQMLERLARPLRLQDQGVVEVTPSASVGIALSPNHGVGHETLMRHAELAADEAKRAGGRRCKVFNPGLVMAIKTKKDLERELARAIDHGDLCLHYQPQIDLATGRIVAFEALMRWSHPERGNIPPTTFIPVAETSGLIRRIGPWLLREAMGQARAWRDLGFDLGMAINISPAQLRQQDLPREVALALAQSGMAPERIELEVTESLFVDPAEIVMRRTLSELEGMGLRLAIDDFGTGYSSLAYLKRLPIHRIKIDKSFTDGIGREGVDEALVRTVISLAYTFGKEVLAEGVETEEQRAFLVKEGCGSAQGYLFARPMPPELCLRRLQEEAASLEVSLRMGSR